MKVLVTGATGFLGSILCEELAKEHEVIGISKSGNTERIGGLLENSNFRLVVCDITDYVKARDMLRENPVDAVFHLAVKWESDEDSEDPTSIFMSNANATLNMLHACHQAGVKRFIYTSTMNVYGDAQYLPVDEKHPLKPNNFYGLSKLAGESYCRFYHENHGMNVIILRCSGIYGPKRKGGAAAAFSERAVRGDPITVSNDGNYVWDTVYISDVVDACMKSLAKIDSIGYSALNIGCGPKGVMLKDMVERIIRISGSQSDVKFEDKPAGEPTFYYNIDKAKAMLGFSPKTLEEGLSDYINYLRSVMK
jgi:UDP-glucose 4-epimerase